MRNIPSNSEIDSLFSNIGFSIGNKVRREFERSGNYLKSGIHHANLPNRSSKAYQSPARQSGNLHDDIDVEYDRNDKVIKVGSDVPYLKWLELGTTNMRPRQGLKQAYESVDIESIIDDKIRLFFR